jgi:hypothetical protein
MNAYRYHYYRLSAAPDAAGKFHHYQIWLASNRSAFVAHVADTLPGQTHADAEVLLDRLTFQQ